MRLAEAVEWRPVVPESRAREHLALHDVDLCLSAEVGITPFGWEVNAARRNAGRWEGWLVGANPGDSLRSAGAVSTPHTLGGAIFVRPGVAGAEWSLERVWLLREYRHLGLLTATLPSWLARYGSLSTDPRWPWMEQLLSRWGWRPVKGRTIFDSAWLSPASSGVGADLSVGDSHTRGGQI